LLEHGDAQGGVATKEFAGGPQAREASAHDRDVNVKVTMKRRSWDDRGIQG
jgi:hypothetical protein